MFKYICKLPFHLHNISVGRKFYFYVKSMHKNENVFVTLFHVNELIICTCNFF